MTAPHKIVVAIGLAVLLFGVLLKKNAGKERGWDRVKGKIIRSEVQGGARFRHVCEYSYEYQGVARRGDRVRSLQITVNTRGPAERSAAAYPVGAEVDVYVNPNDPLESVLEPGGHSWFLPFIVAFVVIFCSVLLSACAGE